MTIPLLVCAMAILSNSHQGKARLENERSFDADDFDRIYGDLTPTRHRLLVAPNSTFTRALVAQIDESVLRIELCNSERDLIDLIKAEIPVSLDQIKRLLPDDTSNLTIGGVVINSDELHVLEQQQRSKAAHANQLNNPHLTSSTSQLASSNKQELDNENGKYFQVMNHNEQKMMKIPVDFDISIRAKDFRLGPEPFPKKYSLGPFIHSDHYTSTFFMASQIMLSRAYISLLHTHIITQNSSSIPSSISNRNLNNVIKNLPSSEDIIGQRMPYPKFVSHKRLKESTLGTFVAGSQKQKPFVLTMDYCIMVGFLVTAIFLCKRIVDEKKSRVRNMLRLVGISDWTYYGSHICNTLIIMSGQNFIITILFTSHADAPAQHVDGTLMFFILSLYSLAAIMFVLCLSTCFTSSTKAIIFTSLAWLGEPEVLDRFFKLNAGVVESNGSIVLPEQVHLLFSMLQPNFALRLMNRLLSECDIYGEFYDKKQIYGEYRAIWSNVFTVLPLYKMMTLAYICLAMLLSIPFYASLIYLINSLSSAHIVSLASLSSENTGGSGGSGGMAKKAINLLLQLTLGFVITPFKMLRKLLPGSYSSSSAANDHHETANNTQLDNNLGYVNSTFKSSSQDFSSQEVKQRIKLNSSSGDKQINNCQLELNQRYDNCHHIEVAATGAGGNCVMQGSHPEPPRSPDEAAYFERSPRMLKIGISIRNLSKTFYTSSSQMRQIEAVKKVSLDMFYSQILGKFELVILFYFCGSNLFVHLMIVKESRVDLTR